MASYLLVFCGCTGGLVQDWVITHKTPCYDLPAIYFTRLFLSNSPCNYAYSHWQSSRLPAIAVPKRRCSSLGLRHLRKLNRHLANGRCRLPLPPALERVQQSQRKIAKQEQTLYWDWASAMGGNCQIEQWRTHQPELMRPDLVHLSYALSADRLFAALQQHITRD